MALSQSSTELNVLKSGMDLSNSGCEGLEGGAVSGGSEGLYVWWGGWDLMQY